MKNYNENAYAEAIAGLRKHTGETACTEALDDMLQRLNDEEIINMFIRENGKMMTEFRRFFKGIEDVPTKYWCPHFDHNELNIARDPYRRTKRLVSSFIDGDFEHDAIYLSIISHLDCAAHSIVNQLKRNLGMFERFNKLSNK